MSTTNNNSSFPPMPREPIDQAREYFALAMKHGFLSLDKKLGNYVHNFMYMGKRDNHVEFKDRIKRGYLCISLFLLEE